MARCHSGSSTHSSFIYSAEFAHTSSQGTWFWRVTRPLGERSNDDQKLKEKVNLVKEVTPFSCVSQRSSAYLVIFVLSSSLKVQSSISLFFIDWGLCGCFCTQRFQGLGVHLGSWRLRQNVARFERWIWPTHHHIFTRGPPLSSRWGINFHLAGGMNAA